MQQCSCVGRGTSLWYQQRFRGGTGYKGSAKTSTSRPRLRPLTTTPVRALRSAFPLERLSPLSPLSPRAKPALQGFPSLQSLTLYDDDANDDSDIEADVAFRFDDVFVDVDDSGSIPIVREVNAVFVRPSYYSTPQNAACVDCEALPVTSTIALPFEVIMEVMLTISTSWRDEDIRQMGGCHMESSYRR